MVHKVKKLAKGFMFVSNKADLDAEREAIENMVSDEPFTIHSAVQNVYTGSTMSLFSTASGDWFVKMSSNDLATFRKDEKTARKYYADLYSIQGELI
jgi:3-hydroxyisobutyrate dehydrogenase-like beta-hydroxyacid dehydrogenase